MKLHNRNLVGGFQPRMANLNHVGAIIQTNDHLKSIYFAFGVRILHESVIMETLQNKLLILSNHSARWEEDLQHSSVIYAQNLIFAQRIAE